MGFFRRIKNALTGARQAEQLAQINRRLERLEAQGDTLHKIWLRTRHVEPAIQALLRARYIDPASLPYPERLTAQRFRGADDQRVELVGGLSAGLERGASGDPQRPDGLHGTIARLGLGAA